MRRGAGWDEFYQAVTPCWPPLGRRASTRSPTCGAGGIAAKEELSSARPVALIDYTAQLAAPLLGLFGNDDTHPSPAQVDQHEAELKLHGKAYESHRCDGAGHGIFYYFY
jgi:pimeloyl-ACP methyl ester carboxylesterase